MSRHLAVGAALAMALWALALASVLAGRAPRGELCRQDRVPLDAYYRVDLVIPGGRELGFCNVTCARLYLKEHPGRPERIVLRDEETGDPLAPEEAVFVRSPVFTHRESSNRVHVFADPVAARQHRETYGGQIVEDPFAEPAP